MAEENSPESGASPKDPEPGATDSASVHDTPAAAPAALEAAPVSVEADAPSALEQPVAAEPVAAQSTARTAAKAGAAGALTPGQRLAAKKAQKAVEKRESKEERKRGEDEARQKEQEEADRLLGRARPEPGLPAAEEKVASTFTDFLQDNRERILLAVGAAVVIALVVFGAQRFLRSGAAEQAAVLSRALELASAPVDAEDTDGKTDDGKPVFKTEQDRATKSLTAFDQVVAAGVDRPAGVWAKLAAAAAELQLGKYDAARARFQSVYDAHVKEPQLAARGLEGVGVTLEAAGKPEDALKAYDKLKYIEGSKELADFHVARIKLAKGDSEAGKTLLKTLYDQLNAPTEGSAPSRYLKPEVEVRLAEIDSTLVDKGSSAGEGQQQFSDEQIQRLLEQLQQKGGAAPGAPPK